VYIKKLDIFTCICTCQWIIQLYDCRCRCTCGVHVDLHVHVQLYTCTWTNIHMHAMQKDFSSQARVERVAFRQTLVRSTKHSTKFFSEFLPRSDAESIENAHALDSCRKILQVKHGKSGWHFVRLSGGRPKSTKFIRASSRNLRISTRCSSGRVNLRIGSVHVDLWRIYT